MPTHVAAHRAARARDVKRVKALLRSGEGARALRMLGDRWSFLILRDAFLGVRRFEDLRRLTGAARGTLSARLDALVENGILRRTPSADAPSRYEYRLTEKGHGFYPVALALWSWESRWSDAAALPPRLIHATCGKKMHPLQTCSECDKEIDRHDVSFEAGPGRHYAGSAQQATRRRETPIGRPAKGVDATMFHAVDTIGDRWSGLLLATLFFGLHRYDDINAAIGIATNILADRFPRLLAAGVIEQHLYRDRPPRYEYRLTPKGWDLYPFNVALHDWATRWLPAPHGPALRLRHKPCGHLLTSKMTCGECGGELAAHEIKLSASPAWSAARVAPRKRVVRGKAR